jgi:hypothetical protein
MTVAAADLDHRSARCRDGSRERLIERVKNILCKLRHENSPSRAPIVRRAGARAYPHFGEVLVGKSARG